MRNQPAADIAIERYQCLEEIVATIRDVVWLATADLKELLYVSPMYEEIWGRSVGELYENPMSFLDSVHPEDRPGVERQMLQEQLHGFHDEFTQEVRIVRPDGGVRFVRTRYSPVRDSQGTVVRLAGSSVDVTEMRGVEAELRTAHRELEQRVRERTDELQEIADNLRFEIAERQTVEAALRQSEAQLMEAQRIAHLGNWVWDLRQNALHWSEEAYRIFGLPEDEFGFTFQAFLELVHADDRPAVKRAVEQALFFETPYRLDHRIQLRDGQIRHVHAQAEVLLDADSRTVLMAGTVQDVTERKLVEQELRDSRKRLQDILDSMFAFVGLFTLDGIVVEANRAPLDAAGLTRDEVIGQPFAETYWWSYSPQVQQQLGDALDRAAAGQTVRYDVPVRVAGGQMITIDVTFGPLYDSSGRVAMLVGSAVDITDRLQAQERARLLQAELAHVARVSTMGEMATGIAHELNQPLSAIASFAYAVRTNLDSGEPLNEAALRNSILRIENQSLRAGEIVKRLRRLVHRSSPHCSPVDLNNLIEEILEMLQTDLRIAEITLVMNLEHPLPLVPADGIQIQQVLLNLVRNAIDAVGACEPGRRQIVITTSQRGCQALHVGVRDTGPGLSPEALERVFQAFYTTKEHGLGMGLAICRSIIEAHRGRLWAESTSGVGANFQFELPVADWRNDEFG